MALLHSGNLFSFMLYPHYTFAWRKIKALFPLETGLLSYRSSIRKALRSVPRTHTALSRSFPPWQTVFVLFPDSSA